MPYAPSLVARVDFVPVPRVEIVFASVPAGAVSATVFRSVTSLGRSYRRAVRGGIGVAAAGGFSLVDFEAPFAVAVQYQAQLFAVDGSDLGFTDSASVTVAFTGTVIHQPTDPRRNVIVDPLVGFAETLVRPFAGQVARIQGRTSAVYIGSGRSGLQGVNLDVATDTLAQAAQLENVFGDVDSPQVPVVCIRTQPRWRLPMPFYAAVLAPTEERLTIEFGGEIIYWRMSGDEVAPPVESLVVPSLTYADLEAAYGSYSLFEAAYGSYLSAESDYSLAGTA